MAPVKFPAFCGSADTQRSVIANDEDTINRYVEMPSGAPKASPILTITPGIQAFASIGTGPVRALFAQDNRAFGVGGTVYGELMPDHGVAFRGTVASSSIPATITTNGAQGHQNLITSGGLGYIHDLTTNAFTQITDTDFPTNVIQAVFLKGYFLVLDSTGRFQLSEQYDGLSWNALDFGIVSDFSDTVVSMTVTHDTIGFYGTRNAEWWSFTGNADFPMEPVSSSKIEHGTGAAFAALELDNAPIWLVQDEFGGAMVVRAQGYTPVRISTHAVEYDLLRVGDLSQSVAWGYQEQGHSFYVLQIPGLPWTWTYDVATGQWHKRARWNPDLFQWERHEAINHCYVWNRHFVGDQYSGTVFEQSLAFGYDLLVP